MGFFEKMKEADIFVVLDNVKFRKNYFQNRNKFKNSQGVDEWFGVSVPKKSSSKLIKEITTVEDSINNWRKKVITKLKYSFNYDFSDVYTGDSLIDINMRSIQWARKILNIENRIVYASDLAATGSKSELLSNICKELNASTYISGPSGRDYLDLSLFSNIKVEFFHPKVENYYSCVYNLIKTD
tara:strand:+ start:5195 stop:5746 length:552 start_codon:yes stop_codon:yes gene_type:complete